MGFPDGFVFLAESDGAFDFGGAFGVIEAEELAVASFVLCVSGSRIAGVIPLTIVGDGEFLGNVSVIRGG